MLSVGSGLIVTVIDSTVWNITCFEMNQMHRMFSEQSPAPLTPFKRPTILLVEDDVNVRSFLINALRGRCFEVIEAEDGQAALKISRAFDGDIQLLLTDIDMPKMDGAELSTRILAERSGIRVLQMSGGCRGEAPRNGPALPFLPKPFQISTLFSKIAEVMAAPLNYLPA